MYVCVRVCVLCVYFDYFYGVFYDQTEVNRLRRPPSSSGARNQETLSTEAVCFAVLPASVSRTNGSCALKSSSCYCGLEKACRPRYSLGMEEYVRLITAYLLPRNYDRAFLFLFLPISKDSIIH